MKIKISKERGSMKKVITKRILACMMAVITLAVAIPFDGIEAFANGVEAAETYYMEDFTYPEAVDNEYFLPADWSVAGNAPSLTAIRYDGDNYYYEVGRAGDTGSSYIGKIFTENLADQYFLSMDINYTNSANVNLFMYENRLNAGNLAIRVGIKKDGNGGYLYAFDGGTQKTLVENMESLGWINLSYIINNETKEYEVVLSDLNGEVFYQSDVLAYNNSSASKAGAISINCDLEASILVDNICLASIAAEEPETEPVTEPETEPVTEPETEPETEPVTEPEFPYIDFYLEEFTYPESLNDEAFLPEDWSTAGVQPSVTAIRQESDNYYYEIGRPGETGSSYIGKKFNMTLPDQYTLSLDMKYINSATVNLVMYESSLNSGNLAVRSGITKNNSGGALCAYDGGNNKVLVSNMESYGWVNLSYVIDNAARKYEVVLTSLTGEELYHSEQLSFYSSIAGKAGAFAFNCNAEASIMVDNIRLSGEEKPYVPTPAEGLPEKTGKVTLSSTDTGYILSNDYTKITINTADANVTSMIRYISENSNYEDGGYEVLGGVGYGYYLLNYVQDGVRGQNAIKNAVGEIVKDEEDYCEIMLTMDDCTQSPVALEFHFVMEDDTEGVYMYARSRRATGATGKIEIEQSRYAFRLDSRLYGYGSVADKDLVKFPELEEYGQRLFDSTNIMSDGSIYTKYMNYSYQYNSFVCGAYGDGLGFSLVTPSREWAGGGYTKQDIDVHDSGSSATRLVNWHLSTAHSGTGNAKVSEDWEKLYGPILWYANEGTSKEAVRQDAIEKTESEVNAWPYNWVEDEGYSISTRSEVKGNFSVKNGEIVDVNNDITPEGVYGWAVLSDTRSTHWQKDNEYYEFYAPIQEDGSFLITGVRPGTYKININVNGVIGEYEQNNIIVEESTTVDLGNIVWDDPIYGDTLWTIGIADRTAEEYFRANPYRYWGGHLMFDQLFPNGVNYKVGESDYTKDWYFVHMASQTSGLLEHNDGSFYFDENEGVVKYNASLGSAITVDDERWKGDQATNWNILFDSDQAYSNGKATLVVAISGARQATLVVHINGVKVMDVLNIGGSGALPRCSLADQYTSRLIEFDATLLKKGENVISLSHESPCYAEGQTEIDEMYAYKSIIYDAIRLDVDTNEPEEETEEETETGSQTETDTQKETDKTVKLINQAKLKITGVNNRLTFGNSATLKASGGSGGGAISYEIISGKNYISLNSSSGKLLATGIGQVTIKITKSGTSKYSPTSTTVTFKTVMPKKNDTIIVGNNKYKVAEIKANKETLSFEGIVDKNVKKVTIPPTVKIGSVKYKVTEIAKNALKNRKKLTSVSIGKNIISIGNSAFQGCTSLKAVTTPSNIVKIGKKAFYNAKKLKTIIIKSKKLTKIGAKAFGGIHKNAKVSVPKSKRDQYSKLLSGKGISKTAKIQ